MSKIWLLRLAVSCLILGALVWIVPTADLWHAIRAVPLSIWLATLMLFLLGHAAAAYKWSLLMPAHGGLSRRVLLSAHFAGLVANLCLPGLASGDVVRAGWIIKHAGRSEDVALAGVVDRVIDCAALLTLAVAGLAIHGGTAGRAGRVIVFTAAGLAAGIMAALTYLRLARVRQTESLVGRLVGAGRLLTARPWQPVLAFLMSVAIQFTFLLLNLRLGRTAGVTVGLTAWLVAWPLAKIAALIPLGLAGLGLREAALVAFLKPFGAAPAPVVAAGLLWEAVLFAGGFVGWLTTMLLPARQGPRSVAPVS